MRMNRSMVLAGYGMLAACSQLLWLSYAFIEAQAHRAMGVTVSASVRSRRSGTALGGRGAGVALVAGRPPASASTGC
jgi:anaerobic glycerol-3-phosphate dehydrogenase